MAGRTCCPDVTDDKAQVVRLARRFHRGLSSIPVRGKGLLSRLGAMNLLNERMNE